MDFVKHSDVALDLKFVAVKLDGTLVGLTVWGIEDLSAFPLVVFLSVELGTVDNFWICRRCILYFSFQLQIRRQRYK